MDGAADILGALKKDGFVMLKKVLDPALVRRANEEVESLLRKDLAERKQSGETGVKFSGSSGNSILDESKHVVLDVFTKSPTLDGLAERLLTDPRVAEAAEKILGKHYKLRGYNIRHMTGPSTFSAMEWHRDNRGEFNFAILLNESGPEGDAATCFIPGSHLFPFCPFQKIFWASPFARYLPPTCLFTKLLGRLVTKNAQAAWGGPGDAYLFLGDVWHGRQPNLNGNCGTVLIFAVFPGEIPFPSHTSVEIPSAEVLGKLPPKLRKIVEYDRVPENLERTAYLYEMEARRKQVRLYSLWQLAIWERKKEEKLRRWREHFEVDPSVKKERYNRLVNEFREAFFSRIEPLRPVLRPIKNLILWPLRMGSDLFRRIQQRRV